MSQNKNIDNTGRLKEGIDSEVIDIIFGKNINQDLKENLRYSIIIDKAHVLMLVEQDIIPKNYGIKILKKIVSLEKSNFKPLRDKQAKRGWYLLYENELIKDLGTKIGGSLHTGRSRNDLHATIFRLRLRDEYIRLTKIIFDIRSSILQLSKKYSNLLFPIHTQMQPALPSIFSHYLLAIDQSLNRDIQFLIESFDEVEYCPLGAGAAGGTTIPINPARTAELLGFIDTKNNSIDSVTSYNYVLRILSALTILGVTISRLTMDFHLWMTKEFNFIYLPDRLKGSSSMMPQKDNPFILEHIKGKIISNIGYLISAVSIMQKVTFSNTIEVKKEASPNIWPAIKKTKESLILLNKILENLQLKKDILLNNKSYEFTMSTALAEYLVHKQEYSFREAHKIVGDIVNRAISSKKSFKEIASKKLGNNIDKKEIDKILDFKNIVKNMKYGGGPGGNNVLEAYNNANKQLKEQIQIINHKQKRYKNAEIKLSKLVSKYLSSQ